MSIVRSAHARSRTVPSARGPLLILALGLLVGACGGSPTASPSLTPTTDRTASATTSPETSPALAPCDPARLAARVTLWEGAAGHRIASVEMSNTGEVACTVQAQSGPQLVGGDGAILIAGTVPQPAAALTVEPGATLRSLVDDSNYCGPTPVPPVTVAFIFPAGLGRIVAEPLSPTDTSGVPPCLGSGAADISMQPWAP